MRLLSVSIADCAPILLAGNDGQTVAAIHAGWRGIISGVVPAAIKAMLQQDIHTTQSRMIAAIDPCIGMEMFEVGPEVLAEFERVFGQSTVTKMAKASLICKRPSASS